MKMKKFLSIIIFITGAVITYGVLAQGPADITFPVVELGNCGSETECKTYCDNPENITVCVSFAERHNLISREEAERARKFAAIGSGPGGCTSKDSCEAYCNDVNHIEECITFAERNGLIPPGELEEARKVQAALAKGAKLPGGCTNKQQCDTYCNEPSHMEECIAFAEAAGFIPPEELAQAKKALEAIRKGVKPPPCRGQQQCDAYCGEPGHFEECIAFAEAAGFVSSEDAAMARKTGGKGPGDCRSKEECESYCNNPANQEACFNFAMEHDLIPPAQLQEMREGMEKLKEGLRMAPPEVLECLRNTVGTEVLDKIQSGALTPGPQIGDQVRTCFEQFMPAPPAGGPPPQGFEGGPPPGFQQAPGEFQPPADFRPPEGFPPPEGFQPSPEQLLQFQQQFQQQFQGGAPPSPEQIQQFQEMMEQQMMPPPPPSSYRGSFFSNLLQIVEPLMVR